MSDGAYDTAVMSQAIDGEDGNENGSEEDEGETEGNVRDDAVGDVTHVG